MSQTRPTTSTSTSATSTEETSSSPEAKRKRLCGSRRSGLIDLRYFDSDKQTRDIFMCSICFDVYEEPVVTKCGHTFCKKCIESHMRNSAHTCPHCFVPLGSDELLVNRVLHDFLCQKQLKEKEVKHELAKAPLPKDKLHEIVLKAKDMELHDVNLLLQILNRKKEILTCESSEHQRFLLTEFLGLVLKDKLMEKCVLETQLSCVDRDLNCMRLLNPRNMTNQDTTGSDSSTSTIPSPVLSPPAGPSRDLVPDGFNSQPLEIDFKGASMASRRLRLSTHFAELKNMYFECARVESFDLDSGLNDATVPNSIDSEEADKEALVEFGKTLSQVTRYTSLKPLAMLCYSPDMLTSANIVSSIEFDKDNDFFAIAGVTKKIKLFDYVNVISANVDMHCPSAELTGTAKISCVAWSSFHKSQLASSDYDGCVTLWDVGTTLPTRVLSEHEKRVWSVDWSNGDPRLLASGSDDSKVKLWSTTAERSVMSLEAKANVCCVKFCPRDSMTVAFGSADHCVHYYDLRKPKQPLGILHGHKKAVSYVKFASKHELVSASTDSNLKMWDLNKLEEMRTLSGHVNEKNFVGLATDGNFVACGSENNSLYVYYKMLSRPLFSFKFDNHRSMLEKPKPDESSEFVSAVAWKKGSNVLVSANSQGSIKVLEMI